MSRRSESKRGAPTRARTGARATREAASPRVRPPEPAPALPLTHLAFLITILVAAASIVVSASYRLHDADLWQLLVVGKAIWTRHAVPRTDEWTWIGFGDPQITTSWGFRALIW